MKKILFAIALALVATACNNNEGEQALQQGSISIEVTTRGEVDNTTSANTVVLESAPAANELKVEIAGNDNTYTWDTLAEFNKAVGNGFTFTSAPYTVTLSHGEKGVEGWSKPYFEGSTTVEVPMYGLSAEASVLVVLANSIVAIDTTSNFDGYFSEATFTINDMAWDAAKEEHLFANAGEATIACTAKRPTGSDITLTQKVTLKPTTRHTILFDLDTVGKAAVTITFDDEIVATEELEFELNENA
ncbi:MAG: DUF4493 domain-containing protein [Rikenellaceae bacterium]|nr:DUF4493 domain-containing protein [Rikenellaceae bacterium]